MKVKKILTSIGVVVSDKMQKSRVVAITRRVRHPGYGKIVKRVSKRQVHDENNESKVGDTVKIRETLPRSKMKSWEIVEILDRAN